MLTSRDLNKITHIVNNVVTEVVQKGVNSTVHTSEKRLINRIDALDSKFSGQMQTLSDQIVLYVNNIAEDHEKRIQRLEKTQSFK